MRGLCVLLLLLTGCTGALIDALNERQAASCIWWSTGPLGFSRGVTATGGVDIRECIAVPCQLVP